MPVLDETHAVAARSWVASAAGHADFPVQNLPLGIFSPPGGDARVGVAIGDDVLDVRALVHAGLLPDLGAVTTAALSGDTLNGFLALGAPARQALRRRLFAVLEERATERAKVEPHLHPAAGVTLHRPVRIGSFTDFFAGIHHAINAGMNFRPDNPLLPNYKHVPIAYHGRASSIVASGTDVRRPNGQRKLPTEESPTFGPARNLDFELELGIWIGPGNAQGAPIPIREAAQHIAGYCLLNDWSARDIQAWEYQPLGPFLAKNFASTISPWIVTPEALAPFRIAQGRRPEGDPAPLPYLTDAEDQAHGALDLGLDIALLTPQMVRAGLPPQVLGTSNARHLYWTAAQMVTHHTCGGCNLEAGDLLGTGTISTPDESGLGSLLEITRGGRQPLVLRTGEERRFLEDGDEVLFSARARRDGYAGIGFGPCRARILPALPA